MRPAPRPAIALAMCLLTASLAAGAWVRLQIGTHGGTGRIPDPGDPTGPVRVEFFEQLSGERGR